MHLPETLPKAVDFHLLQTCNMSCKYCFAQYVSLSGINRMGLPEFEAIRVLNHLWKAGFRKITYAGGEPTLYPHLVELVKHSKSLGFKTAIVTNGSRLSVDFLSQLEGDLDWLTISIDSLDCDVNHKIGRCTGNGSTILPEDLSSVVNYVHQSSISLRINTVVSKWNWSHDMRDLPVLFGADRWKIVRALKIAGENTLNADEWSISDEEFASFIETNTKIDGIEVTIEDNDAMIGSYVMVDPNGRFLTNIQGLYQISSCLLEVGADVAVSQLKFDVAKYKKRGGHYWEYKE